MAAKQLTFIDLFAGIGGMRLAFQKHKAKCVFSSEWNKPAQLTYAMNFGEFPAGDITQIKSQDIPQHDILVGGFPCQPFSISGVSKKISLGRPHGFADPTQGTLFFEIKRILHEHRPRAFLLENVKNLRSHDKGRTMAVILETLAVELGYDVHFRVLDAVNYVPQHRERVFIVGFREKTPFRFPLYRPPVKPRLRDILDRKVDDKYILSDKLWAYLQQYAAKHQAEGNGFGYGMADLNGNTRTLSARYYKDGSEILVPRPNGNPRRLTPRECARLMGYPEKYRISGVSDTQLYRQFGNSVVVPVVTDVAGIMVRMLSGSTQLPRRKHYTYIDGEPYDCGLLGNAAA